MAEVFHDCHMGQGKEIRLRCRSCRYGSKGDACILCSLGIDGIVADVKDVFFIQPEMVADPIDSIRRRFCIVHVLHADDEVDEELHGVFTECFVNARAGLRRYDTAEAPLFLQGL